MNTFMQEQWPMYEGTHAMRSGLLDVLTDADLAFSPGGQAMPLGALLWEFGEIERCYIESLKAFKQDFNYHNAEPGLEGSLARIRAWYQALDADMESTLAALSDDDLKKTVERGSFAPAVDVQMQIYLQALLIFFGKATIYLRTMNRPLPKMIQDWIG